MESVVLVVLEVAADPVDTSRVVDFGWCRWLFIRFFARVFDEAMEDGECSGVAGGVGSAS